MLRVFWLKGSNLFLVRTRKGFDVKFLADTFGISPCQVSKIHSTWITFLSLVLWPSRYEMKKSLQKGFKERSENVRIIVDCLELFIQNPKIPSSQKITWSSYKHWNTMVSTNRQTFQYIFTLMLSAIFNGKQSVISWGSKVGFLNPAYRH